MVGVIGLPEVVEAGATQDWRWRFRCRYCEIAADPAVACRRRLGFGNLPFDEITRIVAPNDTQRGALEALAASAKAGCGAGICPVPTRG